MSVDPRRTSAQRLGDAAESLVAIRLAALGWRILGRQVRIGRDEIDLLAVDPGPPMELVVVEVRWRSRRDFGLVEETFDWRKRRHLHRALYALLATGRLADGQVVPALAGRVDLVVVEPPSVGDVTPRIRHHRSVA